MHFILKTGVDGPLTLGLSQREFANLIRTKNVRIHGSDIGNIEKNLRSEDYTLERLEEYKSAIIKVLSDENKIIGSTNL